ncbi:MAG TPA: hypothetical protein VGH85_07655 [Mycobacteriales bacterium]|jgi:hypothetical protein
MRPFLRLFALGTAATCTVLLAGCGTHRSGQSGAAGSSSSSPSPSASSSPSSGPTSAPPTKRPPGRVPLPGPQQNGPTVSLDGTLTRGAQPSCIVLRTASGQSFQLVGPGAKTMTGGVSRGPLDGSVPVTVKGHIGKNVASYCQVGRPFISDKVTVRH